MRLLIQLCFLFIVNIVFANEYKINELLAVQISDTDYNQNTYSFCKMKNDNFLMAGSSNRSDTSQIWIVCTSEYGNIIWSEEKMLEGYSAYGIKVLKGGNYYYIVSKLIPLTSNKPAHTQVIKLDENYNTLWNVSLEYSEYAEPKGVCFSESEDILYTSSNIGTFIDENVKSLIYKIKPNGDLAAINELNNILIKDLATCRDTLYAIGFDIINQKSNLLKLDTSGVIFDSFILPDSIGANQINGSNNNNLVLAGINSDGNISVTNWSSAFYMNWYSELGTEYIDQFFSFAINEKDEIIVALNQNPQDDFSYNILLYSIDSDGIEKCSYRIDKDYSISCSEIYYEGKDINIIGSSILDSSNEISGWLGKFNEEYIVANGISVSQIKNNVHNYSKYSTIYSVSGRKIKTVPTDKINKEFNYLSKGLYIVKNKNTQFVYSKN